MKNLPTYTHTSLARLADEETKRQSRTINLIASENYASPAVLKALATPLANKYSEGYPGKRYYPGNEFVDAIEERAQVLAKKVFSLGSEWSVNVQPYSGSPANAEVYFALMDFEDTLMGMSLASGGHLTHGHPITFSGRAYKTIQYGVSKDGTIDFNEVLKLAQKFRPKVIISGYSAYPRTVDFKKFGKIAQSVGAYHVADISHIAGLIAARLHPSPFPHADVVVTTTHKTLRGPRGAVIFSKKELSDRIDRAVFPGFQGGPHNNVTLAKAVAFEEALSRGFASYQKQIMKNANALAEALLKNSFTLVSGGTDTHLLLIDLRSAGMDGKTAERILEEGGITANRNSIPGDVKPLYPSGLRLGTPATTTRGMKEREMRVIAKWMCDLILKGRHPTDVKKEVETLCKKFPLPY